MSATQEQRDKLLEVLKEVNLDVLFADPTRQAFLFKQIDAVKGAYADAMRGVPAGLLPPTASLGDILAEHARNPHRVHMLLEAIAFQCTKDILAMAWMTLLGSRIESISYRYVREQTSVLDVKLRLPDLTTERSFSSAAHWDAAVLRFAALSKAGEQPMIEGFHGLWIPPQQTWNHDYYVETVQGNFGAVDVAPTGSPTPRWEVHQVYTKLPSRHIGTISIHVQGDPVVALRLPENERPILHLAWRALTGKYGEASLNVRPQRPTGPGGDGSDPR
jgi:hypothetical protein